MWKKIVAFFNKFVQAFRDLVTAAFPIAKQIIMGKLSEFASNAIKELDVVALTNEEKRKKAFDSIKQYAIKNGIETKDSLINALIELSVLRLKALKEDFDTAESTNS